MTAAPVLDRHCTICGAHLDIQSDPFSVDCGGDCLLCMAEAGDPDCLASVFEWCRNTFRKTPLQEAVTPIARMHISELSEECIARMRKTLEELRKL
jgi:hypothetical protein